MKIHFNRRMALLYNAGDIDEAALTEALDSQKIRLTTADAGALHLSIASLVGFENNTTTRTFGGAAPEQSCIVFSGLTEERLNKMLALLKETEIDLPLKAVLTDKNRGQAFGALIFDMIQYKKEQAEKENSEKEND